MTLLTATEHIQDEVRELIRRRGIDPVTDHRSPRMLIDEVVAHYEERVPVSSLPPLLDRNTTMRHVFDALAGLGPLQKFSTMSSRAGVISPESTPREPAGSRPGAPYRRWWQRHRCRRYGRALR